VLRATVDYRSDFSVLDRFCTICDRERAFYRRFGVETMTRFGRAMWDMTLEDKRRLRVCAERAAFVIEKHRADRFPVNEKIWDLRGVLSGNGNAAGDERELRVAAIDKKMRKMGLGGKAAAEC